MSARIKDQRQVLDAMTFIGNQGLRGRRKNFTDKT